MKVRDLVTGATLVEGASRQSPTVPMVSVLLPTFRRGDSGLLRRTIDSLLNQTLSDIEIIIIDDASTDSTASVIAEAMRADPRISVIRHQHNIGLPAISEYEGFMLARADRIAFAFDDTVFAPTALERLLAESENHPSALIVGWVDLHIGASGNTPARFEALGRGAQVEGLLSSNVIPNSGVMAPRHLLNRVGLYDPHISLARLCDYDLWLRIAREAPIKFIDTRLGEEHGPSTLDSLGATYPLDAWAADDRMRQERNALLRPESFGDVEVFDLASFSSERTRRTIASLTERHLATRPWMTGPVDSDQPMVSRAPRVLVLAHDIDASTQLLFTAVRDDPRLHVRVIDPRHRSLAELTDCDAVIVSRRLTVSDDWISAARALGVPLFYALDDNLPLMFARGEIGLELAEYAAESLRETLASFEGVFTSSPELVRSFQRQQLHERISLLPISAPAHLATPPAAGGPTNEALGARVGLFIGSHRLDGFLELLLPALATLSEDVDTTAVLPARLARRIPEAVLPDEVNLQTFAETRDYFAGLVQLRDANINVLVVPPSATQNAKYKNLHPLMSAAHLDARLVLPDIVPYTELRGVPGVDLVDPDLGPDGWAIALRHAVDRHAADGGVPRSELATRFSPVPAANVILQALATAPSPSSTSISNRQDLLLRWFPTRLAEVRLQSENRLQRSRESSLNADPVLSLLERFHHDARWSRRLHAFRSPPNLPSRLLPRGHGHKSVELSAPLTSKGYASYQVALSPSALHGVSVHVWSFGRDGDLLGIELVDPSGKIVAHSVTALPNVQSPVLVTLETPGATLSTRGTYEFRVFVRGSQPAFLLEYVDRGFLGLRAPLVHPVVEWH